MKRVWSTSNPALRWLLLPPVLVAALISGYLAWQGFTGSAVVGCSAEGGAGCDEVLSSVWAHWLGMPVAFPAALLYLVMLGTGLFVSFAHGHRVQRDAWLLLLVLGAIASSAALWMIGLQLFVLGKFCIFCLVVHACGLAAFGALLLLAPIRFTLLPAEKVSFHIGRDGSAWADVVEETEPASEDEDETHAEHAPEQPLLSLSAVGLVLLGGFVVSLAFVGLHIAVHAKQPTYMVETAADRQARRDAAGAADQADAVQGEASGDVAAASGATSESSADAADAAANLPESDPGDSKSAADSPGDDPPASTSDGDQTGTAAPADPEPRKDPGGLDTLFPAEKQAERLLTLVDGTVKINLAEAIVLGSLDNKYIVVKLFDYTCPHCRVMHQHLEAARKRAGGRLTVVLLPVPLNAGCNPAVKATHPMHEYACLYARLAWAVWRKSPVSFEEFHTWLFHSSPPPEPGIARQKVADLIGGGAMTAALSDPEIDRLVASDVQVYQQCNVGVLPKLIIGNTIISGEASSQEEFFELLATHLKREALARQSAPQHEEPERAEP